MHHSYFLLIALVMLLVVPVAAVEYDNTLTLNVGDVGGDSYADSIYAKNPNQYTLIFSDAYSVLQEGKTKGLFSFGSPYDAPRIWVISVTTDRSVHPAERPAGSRAAVLGKPDPNPFPAVHGDVRHEGGVYSGLRN